MSHSTQCVSNPEMEHGKARLPHTCVEKNTGGKACKFATSTLTTPVQSFVRKPQDHCSSAAKTSLAKQGSIATLRVLPLPSFKQIWHGTHTHTHAHTRFQKRFLEQDTHTNTQVALGQPLTLQQRPAWHGRSRFAGCTLTKRNAGQTRLHRNTEGFATSVLEVNLPWNTHTHATPRKTAGRKRKLVLSVGRRFSRCLGKQEASLPKKRGRRARRKTTRLFCTRAVLQPTCVADFSRTQTTTFTFLNVRRRPVQQSPPHSIKRSARSLASKLLQNSHPFGRHLHRYSVAHVSSSCGRLCIKLPAHWPGHDHVRQHSSHFWKASHGCPGRTNSKLNNYRLRQTGCGTSFSYLHCPPGVKPNSSSALYFPCNLSWFSVKNCKSRTSSKTMPS